MIIALWIVAALLAVVHLTGIPKVLRPMPALAEKLPWAKDHALLQVRLIGMVELLGVLGLILPKITGILPILTPIAAFGLALVQVGAAITHGRHKENFAMNLVLVAAALFVGIGWLAVG
jgi:hypothetical protein